MQKATILAIGAHEDIFWGGYADTHLVVDVELIGKIEKVIRQVKPDFIFCNYPEDTHQDHRHLAQAIMSAT
jgi:LmbE family N-acetylglucosaminyl deacetylase